MAMAVLRPAIVAHPDIIAGIRKNKSVRLGRVVPEPLQHIAVLSVDHQHSRLLNFQIIGELAWDSVKGQNVTVIGDYGMLLASESVFEA